jgi:hypothetical protein
MRIGVILGTLKEAGIILPCAKKFPLAGAVAPEILDFLFSP